MHNYPKRTRKFTQSCCQKPSEERALLHCRPHTLASHTSDKYITAPLLAHCTLMVVAADGKCCRITALAMEIAETLYAVKPAAVWQSQPKVVQTALQHVAYEFVWIRRVRVRIRFSVWFVGVVHTYLYNFPLQLSHCLQLHSKKTKLQQADKEHAEVGAFFFWNRAGL